MQHQILVVDDDSEIRETVIEALHGRGYEVIGAANGAEALDLLRKDPAWCLILMDLSMPVMDGFEMRGRQLADPSLASIPLVIMSALPDIEQHKTALHAVDSFLKPMRLRQLVEVVERHCGRAHT